jgi:hypothetical protein
MAAFFGAVVRSPITGIILILELTGSSNYFLAMLGATLACVTVATLLKDPPIYDSCASSLIELSIPKLAVWTKPRHVRRVRACASLQRIHKGCCSP